MKIQIIGSEKNKDDAFEIIENNNLNGVICLRDEVYIIDNNLIIEQLKEKKIKFEKIN